MHSTSPERTTVIIILGTRGLDDRRLMHTVRSRRGGDDIAPLTGRRRFISVMRAKYSGALGGILSLF